jgi:nijmegen breakage syndrome protein 1
LKYEPLIVTSSCLDYTDKCETKNLLSKVGGYLVNDWRNDCSFVVMESITITVKVIDALLCQRLIVNKKYFQDLIKCCESKKSAILPDPKK